MQKSLKDRANSIWCDITNDDGDICGKEYVVRTIAAELDPRGELQVKIKHTVVISTVGTEEDGNGPWAEFTNGDGKAFAKVKVTKEQAMELARKIYQKVSLSLEID